MARDWTDLFVLDGPPPAAEVAAEAQPERRRRFFGRLRDNGSAGWGLFFVAMAMTVIATVTLAPTVADQFGTIINAVVLLVVLAYVAAGLSLLIGTPERRPRLQERLLGLGALVACGLLIYSSGWQLSLAALGFAFLAWILFRLFARRP